MAGVTKNKDINGHADAINALTVDVEDYFQVSAFEPYVDRREWANYENRLSANMDVLLGLFDSAGVKATFFVLGWVAEHYPLLVRQIADLGHEIASHGYSHYQVRDQNEQAFREDVERTKKLLEDVAGVPAYGYRAASFSIGIQTPWAYDVLAEAGHRYSSSNYPIRHDRYGMREASRFPRHEGASRIVELPVTTVEVAGMRFPCGGGGYFRLLPYAWTRWGIRHVNNSEGQPAMFYLHPWELDPDQPRPTGLDFRTRFRHYVNLKGTERKLTRLLQDFRWGTVMDAFGDVMVEPGG